MDSHVLQTSSKKTVPSRNKEGTIQSKNKIAETWVCKRKSPGHTRRSPASITCRVVQKVKGGRVQIVGSRRGHGDSGNRGRMAQGWNEEF